LSLPDVGKVRINWTTSVSAGTSFSLRKVSDDSVLGLHADAYPAGTSSVFDFVGLTAGTLVYCQCVFGAPGYTNTSLNTNQVTVT
jgi:hypothetical protein